MLTSVARQCSPPAIPRRFINIYPISYRDKDCAVWLMYELQNLAEDVETAYKCLIPMDKLTPAQYRQYATSPTCQICEKPLGAESHFTGAANSQCNLEYRDTKTIPVVFHNLPGYYGHLLMEELAKSGKLRVIPNNTEWYIAMTHIIEDYEIKFKFIDSFRFVALSIDKLTSYLEEHSILSCLKNYGLDAAHYYTAPGLSWDAMLKYTGVELDTLQDVNMARQGKQYMPDYNPSLPSTYLPSGGLKWVEDVNIPDDSTIGYILEVGLQYSQSIHDRQSDLAMAPEKRKPPGSRGEKMLAILYNEERYVVHYRNLKQYLWEGLLVTRIHRALHFNQSD
ncbi:hypothetical protein Trydic_g19814 [Trypoxylus dichotomus]